MIRKFKILLLIIFFAPSCGFTPIYSSKNIENISIEQLGFNGDRTLNNYLRSNLNRYKKRDSEKKIFLEVDTNYQKNILSKDATGKIYEYQLVAEVIFTINQDKKKLIFTHKRNMKNMEDKSDERNYEVSTKQSFANLITQELITKLAEM
jgi:outer membrane lipopolysaccharide assembly protein LptE/RlpB